MSEKFHYNSLKLVEGVLAAILLLAPVFVGFYKILQSQNSGVLSDLWFNVRFTLLVLVAIPLLYFLGRWCWILVANTPYVEVGHSEIYVRKRFAGTNAIRIPHIEDIHITDEDVSIAERGQWKKGTVRYFFLSTNVVRKSEREKFLFVMKGIQQSINQQ